ncbi:MAG: type II secretion system F family protein [Candidatus Omnitrophica bacterium]|nr:type II secretion system F family protein [Candidatus Omnitrophota bacterium]MDD5654611.1 type II secretion system F family protein [Candidatus Omnitrophota bacterium]
MPRYFYIAYTKSGKKKVQDVEEAMNMEELVGRLQAKGLVVINVMPESKEMQLSAEKGAKTKTAQRRMHSGITSDDLMHFCSQLSVLLGAGIVILDALDTIAMQVSSTKLYTIIKNLKKDMEGGLSLHQAMAKYPTVFSDLWINLIESGEAAGSLPTILVRLSSYLERNAKFREKIISAIIYPMILLVVSVSALLFLTVKIIPTFATLFAGFKIQLPLLTKMLIVLSAALRKYFLVFFIAAVVVIYLIKMYIKTPPGRRMLETFLFNMPVGGDFFKVLVAERFCSEMSILIESGVPILYALEISERAVSNLVVSDIIHKVKEDVREGRSLSRPLEKSGFFEPMVVQMVRVGEEIGDLSTMFKKVSSFYQDYVEVFLARFTAMFEPAMLIFMGLMIGVMIIGMFLPIFQIAQMGG